MRKLERIELLTRPVGHGDQWEKNADNNHRMANQEKKSEGGKKVDGAASGGREAKAQWAVGGHCLHCGVVADPR